VLTRDHLFISFSPEDWALAEWLTLRLTKDGYAVWCRRFPVLGGERFPRATAEALTTRVVCVLALLSRASLSNPTATNEWTLGVALGRARGYEVFIPLLTDDIERTELVDWVAADIVPISFLARWETGLGQLLRKLRSREVPCPVADGERVASEARQFLARRRSWHTVL
jgi:hypothetical protein